MRIPTERIAQYRMLHLRMAAHQEARLFQETGHLRIFHPVIIIARMESSIMRVKADITMNVDFTTTAGAVIIPQTVLIMMDRAATGTAMAITVQDPEAVHQAAHRVEVHLEMAHQEAIRRAEDLLMASI